MHGRFPAVEPVTNNLRSLRKAAGFSLTALGAKIGVSHQRIHQLEKQRYISTRPMRLRLAHALNVSPETLGPLPANTHVFKRFATLRDRDLFVGRFRRLRYEAKLSQNDLAAKAGVNRNTVSTLERGRFVPHESTIVRLAQALGIPVAYLCEKTG